MCSMPMDRRTMSSDTPAFFISGRQLTVGGGGRVAGQALLSPMFTRRVTSRGRPGSGRQRPAVTVGTFTPKLRMPERAAAHVFRTRALSA